WVDAHQQDHVDLVHHVLQAVQRGGRIEHQARLGAARLDQLQGAINVLGGFRVEGDIAGAGFEEVADDAVYRFDHQVGVDRRSDAIFAQRRADHRADGQVGHVMVVHDIEMHDVGDRKSTRLNSSHVKISYAVFCLKKKKHIKPKE